MNYWKHKIAKQRKRIKALKQPKAKLRAKAKLAKLYSWYAEDRYQSQL